MVPQIKFEKVKAKHHIIYLGEQDTQFKNIDLDTDERSYIKTRFKDKQDLVVLNRYKYQIIFARIKKEKEENLFLEEARKLGNQVISVLRKEKISSVNISIIGLQKTLLIAFIEGMMLGSYVFNKYKKEKDESPALKELIVDIPKKEQEGINQVLNISKAVYFARDLINEPVSYLNAVKLAEEVKNMAKEASIPIEVFEKKKIESLRMGGLLAVNKGSIDPPTFSILEWKPAKAVNKKPVVLIGKGLVYDTGGLSLKSTANSMDEMKCDMSGGAAVAGAMYAIATNQLPVYVVALIPSTDNRPGGNAYAPGDIITMYNGSTVEVMNTDAEGRMILADALSYAAHYDPQLVITIATLTGSAQMAIGQNALVGMGNASRKFLKEMILAGNQVHERMVEFPFWEEYAEQLKSDVADMKNIGGRMAGAITAGKFLEKFTEYPFIHLDIAGPAFLKKASSYRTVGGTGVGVRLLYQFVKNMINKETKS